LGVGDDTPPFEQSSAQPGLKKNCVLVGLNVKTLLELFSKVMSM